VIQLKELFRGFIMSVRQSEFLDQLNFLRTNKRALSFCRCYRGRQKKIPDSIDPDPKWLAKDFETCVLSRDRECSFIEEDPRNFHLVYHRQMLFFCGHDDLCM
jgi:hypothetical protein